MNPNFCVFPAHSGRGVPIIIALRARQETPKLRFHGAQKLVDARRREMRPIQMPRFCAFFELEVTSTHVVTLPGHGPRLLAQQERKH